MNIPQTATHSNVAIASDPDINQYLRATEVIDWHHPDVRAQAKRLADGVTELSVPNAESSDSPQVQGTTHSKRVIAQACFEWVRDHIRHSFDYQLNPVTYRASDVLKYRTGYCYAKSHLLAALLRANGIPAGFCYQRLSIDDKGAPYCLHGLNGIYLPEVVPTGEWYRVDPRGNKQGVNAQFCPPTEQLAFTLQWPEEADFMTVRPDPLPVVLQCLKTQSTWEKVLENLPDISLYEAQHMGLKMG